MAEPSPYVSMCMTRKQAERLRRLVRARTLDPPKDRVLEAALRRIDAGLKQNDGMGEKERRDG